MRATTRLRQLLQAPGVVMAPGVFGPVPALLAAEAGFKALYMPGGGVAMARLGVPDLGLVTLTEMVDSADAIVRATELPLIADADTGFGNALNVQRTVRDYERAGVAGLHLEDQVFPKKCSHFAGKALVSLEEAAQKIRAACAARHDPDFLIIARCDALNVTDMDDVQRRCAAYREAGADMVFVDGPRTLDEVAEIPRRIGGSLLYNQSAGGRVPFLTSEHLATLGYKLMILPNFSALAAIKAIRALFAEIREDGGVGRAIATCAPFKDFTALGRLAEFEALERRFAADGD